jgi:hypothetical protein
LEDGLLFSRYNIQDVSDLAVAAKKIEDRAAAARHRAKPETDKKATFYIQRRLGWSSRCSDMEHHVLMT